MSDDLFPSRDEMNWSVLRDLEDIPHPLVNNAWHPPENDTHRAGEMFIRQRNIHHLLDLADVPHGYGLDTRDADSRVLLLVLAFLKMRDAQRV